MTQLPKNFDKIESAAQKLVKIMQEFVRRGAGNWTSDYNNRWYRQFSALADEVFKDKRLNDLLSVEDVRERLWGISMYSGKAIKDIKKEDIVRVLRQLLCQPELFDFYFPQLELAGFLDRYPMGYALLHTYDNLPQAVKDQIASDWDFHYEEENELYHVQNRSAYEHVKRQETYLCLSVEALGSNKALEIATTRANQSLNLFKCIYIADYLPKLKGCYWRTAHSSGSMTDFRYKIGGYSHPKIAELEKYMTNLTALIQRKQNDEIARRCLTAIDVYGMIDSETPLQVKFLLSVIAAEGLLLGKDDRDFLGWKLREKVAILLGDTPAMIFECLNKRRIRSKKDRVAVRAILAKRVGDMYDKRSRFAHADAKEKDRVNDADFRFASMIFRLSLQRLLTLREKGITRIRKETETPLDAQSLDSFIETLKYSAALGPAELAN